MAAVEKLEFYCNAIIDVEDMTITECDPDNTQVHSIADICKRWHGVEGVTITISATTPLPGKKEGEWA